MTRPFDSARYEALLKGLECSEVQWSFVLASAETKRFDPEYYQKRHLADVSYANSASHQFRSFADYGLRVDASAFYPSIEAYYGQGSLPFLRVADVDTVIDFEQCTRIPPELCDRFQTLSRVHPGDIVFTKGGSVARIGLVTEEAAVSRDLIFLNSSTLSESDRTFLYLYFQTEFFNRMLLRSSSQTAQPHLTITLVRNLPVFIGSPKLKEKCVELVKKSYAKRTASIREQQQAEQVLLRALGLEGWQPPESLTYTRRASEVFTAGRLDAEHYKQKYYAAKQRLQKAGARGFIPLDELLSAITNGHTPLHHNLTVGEVPFLCAEHVTDFEIHYDSEKRILIEHHEGELSRTALQNEDVLLTIKGRVGNVALVESVPGAVNINQDVALLRFNGRLPVWFVLAYLNSFFGKLEVERMSTGGINPFLGLSNVRKLQIPVFDERQMEEIGNQTRAQVYKARAARSEARTLLERAKRAVEVAIEESEAAALGLLNSTEEF